MNKRNIIVGGVLGLVLLIVLGAYGIYKITEPKGYSVVYLSNGELYVGKLRTFPVMELRDAYIFQATTDPADPTKRNFQLNPLKEALWAPSYLSFNREQTLFYGPVEESSQVFQTIQNAVK